MPRPTPLVIGHRGSPGYRPEHTRSSYDLALAMGVDAVEPDLVMTKDGVIVVRHENEISGTTDVAFHPEFADRKTTKNIDGHDLTGWFTEDFTWDELSTLKSRERLPNIRQNSATFDGQQGILRLSDLLELVERASLEQGRRIGVVLEIKHATYFESIGMAHADLLPGELRAAGWDQGKLPIWIESFEQTVLTQLRDSGIKANYIYLLEHKGTAFDLVTQMGDRAIGYAAQFSPRGLDRLANEVDGISVDKRVILAPDRLGRSARPSSVVSDAHARGLQVFTWTVRPENQFLIRQFRSSSDKAAFGHYEAEWAIVRDSGVDGVFVDHADLGVAFFRR